MIVMDAQARYHLTLSSARSPNPAKLPLRVNPGFTRVAVSIMLESRLLTDDQCWTLDVPLLLDQLITLVRLARSKEQNASVHRFYRLLEAPHFK